MKILLAFISLSLFSQTLLAEEGAVVEEFPSATLAVETLTVDVLEKELLKILEMESVEQLFDAEDREERLGLERICRSFIFVKDSFPREQIEAEIAEHEKLFEGLGIDAAVVIKKGLEKRDSGTLTNAQALVLVRVMREANAELATAFSMVRPQN